MAPLRATAALGALLASCVQCCVSASGNCTCMQKPTCSAGEHPRSAGNCGGHGQYPYYCCSNKTAASAASAGARISLRGAPAAARTCLDWVGASNEAPIKTSACAGRGLGLCDHG